MKTWKNIYFVRPDRRLVEVKLNALGVDPKPAASVAASGSQPGASSAAAAEVAK